MQLSDHLLSVVVLEKVPCHRQSSRTNLQVLVLVLRPHILVHKVLKNCQGLCILQIVWYV